MGFLIARLIRPFLVIFSLCFLQAVQAQDKLPVEGDCLIRLLGEHINNPNVQELIEYMGLEPPYHHLRGTEIISPQKGIRITFDKEFRLIAIALFNSNYVSNGRTYSRFGGQLPFKITFKEGQTDLEAKLGKKGKVKNSPDSTFISFRHELIVDVISSPAKDGELYYVSFMLKKKNKSYSSPAKLNCDSLAKE
jgi:hypothetical protein